MTRFAVPIIISVMACTLLVPLMSRTGQVYAEERLMSTAAVVPPTYTPVPTATTEPTPTATAEPLPTAIPAATDGAGAGTDATALPVATVSGRASDITAPIATALPDATTVPVATALSVSNPAPADASTAVQTAPVVAVAAQQPVIQPTAIVLPTAAPMQPLTQPISKNPALQTTTGIVDSLHLWGTQPLVMLMLICGCAGFGFLYYGQRN